MRRIFQQRVESVFKPSYASNQRLHESSSLFEEIEQHTGSLAPDLPYEKVWQGILPNYLMEQVDQIDQIIADPNIFGATLMILNEQMKELEIEDPQEALTLALTNNEKLDGKFSEPVIISELASVQQFQDMLLGGGVFDDVGVSYIHGRFTHRIQRMMLSLTLGRCEITDIISDLSNTKYTRENEQCSKFDDREVYTWFDDLLDRLPEFKIVNENKLKLREVFKAVEDGQEELLRIPFHFYPLLDARTAEWIPSFIRISTDPSIELVRQAFLQERSKRLDEVHTSLFITQQTLDFERMEREN